MSNYYNRQWRLPNNENKDKQSNYSLSFDGSSYIDFGNSLNFVTSNYSLSFWIKTTSTTNLVICEKGANDEIAIQTLTAGNIRWAGTNGSDTSGVNVSDNNWHHLVFVANGSSSFIYIDGSLNTTGGNKIKASSNTDDFYIGSRAGLYGFNGQLDGVAIYNYALSSSQVTTLYGSSSTGIGNPMSLNPKPVAYYPLGDQDSFNGAEYLVPNSSLKDYVFNFDGSNDYIDLTSDITLLSNRSISMWIKVNAGFSFAVLFGGDVNVFYPYIDTNNIAIRNNDTSTAIAHNGISVGVWYNFCVTGNGTTASFYQNGSLLGTGSDKNLTLKYINAEQAGLYGLNGSISNVQIFNSALPATGSNSVETLYNNGSPLTSMSGFTSLQGWWKLDASATYDSSTTTWTIPDSSSNSNTGTSSGMTQSALQQSDLSFKTSISPFALSFDGANDGISITGTATTPINPTGTYSVSAWVKPSNVTTANQIFTKYGSSDSARAFGFLIHTDGRLRLLQRATGVSDNTYTTSTISANVWTHVSVVRTTSSVSLYINGNLDGGVQSNSFVPNDAGTQDFYIGRNDSTSITYFTGSISNVSIWNAALTSAQVSEIYSEGVPQNLNNHSAYSNLVSWWQLGSNSSFNTNWTVLDEKGTNNGTSSNMTESDIVDGVGSYANGTSSGMGGDEIIGDAPYSTANSLSVNMDVEDRVSDTPS